MRTFPVLLTLSVAVAFAACSSSDDDEPDTPRSFCERWAAAACSSDVVSACQAADTDDCRVSQTAFCLDQLPASGFSGARAAECVDAVEAAYEDADITADEIATVLRFAAPCDQLVRGQQGEGESCDASRDCDTPSGFACVFKGGSNQGTCQLPASVGPGEDCSATNAVCGPGFYCNGDNCIAGERVGDPCTSNEQCGLTGYCGLTSTCEARRAVDSPCGFDEQCATGLCYAFSPTDQVCTDRVRLSRTEPLCEDLR
jgi:nitrous oxide reductase accessory protein NosL